MDLDPSTRAFYALQGQAAGPAAVLQQLLDQGRQQDRQDQQQSAQQRQRGKGGGQGADFDAAGGGRGKTADVGAGYPEAWGRGSGKLMPVGIGGTHGKDAAGSVTVLAILGHVGGHKSKRIKNMMLTM